jgi:hypothetical protein
MKGACKISNPIIAAHFSSGEVRKGEESQSSFVFPPLFRSKLVYLLPRPSSYDLASSAFNELQKEQQISSRGEAGESKL